jgi:alpha-L-fucosidase 2
MFVSAPENTIVIRLTTDNPAGISFDARLARQQYYESCTKADDSSVYLKGDNDGIAFYAMLKGVATQGSVEAIGEYLVFREVKEAILFVAATTSFREADPASYCQSVLSQVAGKAYEAIRKAHIADYQTYESRMSLRLESKTDAARLPTDERLERFRQDPSDVGLIELYFRYGRYLLISCSRPGTLAANLQGIWCKDFLAPWGSRYTININTQMNYWLAESCNLSDCHGPLFDLIKSMHAYGLEMAREMYGAKGFVAHHNTDLWGDTAPQGIWIQAVFWVMSIPWLCLHLWEHYQYRLDKSILEEHYDLMRDCVLFFADYLIENENGFLVISPTCSPENTYELPDGTTGSLCAGCTMDSQILHEFFHAFTQVCDILNTDQELSVQVVRMMEKLPKMQIGKHGTIMEWLEDYKEAEPGHRHISQLFGLFPGSLITVEDTPELAQAAKQTLERRLQFGGGHTGWSAAWNANFWVRLREKEAFFEAISKLLSKSTYNNLLDAHPPFQIDGNLGAAAAIANALVWSKQNQLYLLYALPKQWPKGRVSGLCAKGGLTLDLEWENGKLVSASFHAQHDYSGELIYEGKRKPIDLEAGQSIQVSPSELGTDFELIEER